jgi:hypothetical protein
MTLRSTLTFLLCLGTPIAVADPITIPQSVSPSLTLQIRGLDAPSGVDAPRARVTSPKPPAGAKKVRSRRQRDNTAALKAQVLATVNAATLPALDARLPAASPPQVTRSRPGKYSALHFWQQELDARATLLGESAVAAERERLSVAMAAVKNEGDVRRRFEADRRAMDAARARRAKP